MAQSIKVGSLVKYKDHEGNLNGGTIISFREDEDYCPCDKFLNWKENDK